MMNENNIPGIIKSYICNKFGKITPYTHEKFFEEIPDLEDKKLLDVGAGTFCMYSLSGYLPQVGEQKKSNQVRYEENQNVKDNIVALDRIYDDELCFLPERSICGDARKLPFHDESFDIVAAGWLFDYFKNESELEEVISECARVLNPKGYLVGDVPLHPTRPIYEKFRKLKFLLGVDELKHAKQIEKYQRIIRTEEFEVLENGIGFNSNNPQRYLTFYFITQKG